jgi:hypothetical protein
MMTNQVKQNYTPAQTLDLVNRYKSGEAVETIAEALGKTTRSVVAKLSREGVYQAKTATKGQARVKKSDLVDQLAHLCGVAPEMFDSLEKANHDVLEALVAKIA